MRKTLLGALLLFSAGLYAQVTSPSIILVGSAPSGSCTAGLPNRQVASTGVQYSCQNGTWGQVGSGGGGTVTGVTGTTNQIASSGGTAPAISFATPFASAYSVTAASGNLLAVTHSTYAGTPAMIEIYPDATAKPDEGNASVAGTVAWGVAQLTSGGKIFVHEGAYTVDTTITMGTAGTHLECANPISTTFTPAASFNSTMFKVGWAGTQHQGMEIRNCGFNGANGTNTSGTIVWVRDTAYTLLQDNYFQYAAKNGVIIDATVSGAVYNKVINNAFIECVEECFILNGQGGASNATDSLVTGNSIGGSVIGDGTKPWVSVYGLGSLQFNHNHVSGPTHTTCLTFNNSSQTDVQVTSNEIENCPQHGIVLAGQNATIADNLFYNVGTATTNTYADVYLQSSAYNAITGNSFRGQGTTKYGVYSDEGTQYNTISNNLFNNLTGYAIQFLNPYAGGNVIGPNLYNNNTSGILNQAGGHYGPNVVTLQGPAGLSSVAGQINANGIALAQLATASAPVITTSGTAGAATWTYVIVAKDITGTSCSLSGASPASSTASTTTGNATLSGSNFTIVTWQQVNGAYSYDVYRTAHGTSPTTTGCLGNVLATTLQSGSFNSYTYNDTGAAANGATAPTVNQTGNIQAYYVSPSLLYSAAGTALPTCATEIKGLQATVSDATTPTYEGTYASGGTSVAAVICNGTNWLTH